MLSLNDDRNSEPEETAESVRDDELFLVGCWQNLGDDVLLTAVNSAQGEWPASPVAAGSTTEWAPLCSAVVMSATSDPHDKAKEIELHNSPSVADLTEGDPAARTYTSDEIGKSSPAQYEEWRLAAEREVEESFRKMGAITETTEEELRAIGGKANVLPMMAVWVRKSAGLHKCRGCICGNVQRRDPHEQLWTAQAEPSSVLSGIRLAQLRGWDVVQTDVKSAFMHSPVPEGVIIVVRPPAIWIKMGAVAPDTLWTLRRFVYGLRVSPTSVGRDKGRRPQVHHVGREQ